GGDAADSAHGSVSPPTRRNSAGPDPGVPRGPRTRRRPPARPTARPPKRTPTTRRGHSFRANAEAHGRCPTRVTPAESILVTTWRSRLSSPSPPRPSTLPVLLLSPPRPF